MFAPTIKVAAIEFPGPLEVRTQPAVKVGRGISITGIIILGNILTALAYAALYGYAAGTFN